MSTNVDLYGKDLFGNSITPDVKGKIREQFIIPPFSVLNAREGFWQERKRMWLNMGIESEIGRNAACNVGAKNGTLLVDVYRGKEDCGHNISENGTSIFDPVLAELFYKWFCPTSGQIVDPFAGGSVRGVVASLLGFQYWGCELRQEQVDANRQQAIDILGNTVSIKVSAKMLMQQFHPCTEEFIQTVCQGRCCEGSNGIKVTIHKTERQRFNSGEFLQADDRGLCPYKSDDGFCSIHTDKPKGCQYSPFTLNANDTLIVRNRYRLLKCYKTEEGKQPAYLAHAQSLKAIIGLDNYSKIEHSLSTQPEKDITIEIDRAVYDVLKDNDAAKGSQQTKQSTPEWICGDSLVKLHESPEADFLFSCPPYGDLEKYSDLPQDLSNMDWHAFLPVYKNIVRKAVQRLKNDRFAAFVVGDLRNKKGFYRNFVSETIAAFQNAGMNLYNECIYITPTGSLPIRITRQFNAGRKLGKTHQNILVFVKGDPKVATKNITG